MTRYKVMTRKTATSSAVDALDRALNRVVATRSGPLAAAKIMDSGGRLQVQVDVSGATSCTTFEDAFASVWYDAFGERGAGLLNCLIERQIETGVVRVDAVGKLAG